MILLLNSILVLPLFYEMWRKKSKSCFWQLNMIQTLRQDFVNFYSFGILRNKLLLGFKHLNKVCHFHNASRWLRAHIIYGMKIDRHCKGKSYKITICYALSDVRNSTRLLFTSRLWSFFSIALMILLGWSFYLGYETPTRILTTCETWKLIR